MEYRETGVIRPDRVFHSVRLARSFRHCQLCTMPPLEGPLRE
jgi:hypothetical protein